MKKTGPISSQLITYEILVKSIAAKFGINQLTGINFWKQNNVICISPSTRRRTRVDARQRASVRPGVDARRRAQWERGLRSTNLLKRTFWKPSKPPSGKFLATTPNFWQSCNSMHGVLSMCQAELKNFASFFSYLPKTIFLNCNFLENANCDLRKKISETVGKTVNCRCWKFNQNRNSQFR